LTFTLVMLVMNRWWCNTYYRYEAVTVVGSIFVSSYVAAGTGASVTSVPVPVVNPFYYMSPTV
jgi:hypothetical protein